MYEDLDTIEFIRQLANDYHLYKITDKEVVKLISDYVERDLYAYGVQDYSVTQMTDMFWDEVDLLCGDCDNEEF